jgi:hypothetical protein
MSSHLRRLSFAILFVLGATSPLIGQAVENAIVSLRQQEVGRITSPDLCHDAVTILTRPLLPYMRSSVEVYLVPRGGPVTRAAEPVLLATKAEGVESTWKDNRLLEIRYLRARVEGFTAVWSPFVKSPRVEIRLSPPAAGPSFESGDDS